jgi:hypothetical protein
MNNIKIHSTVAWQDYVTACVWVQTNHNFQHCKDGNAALK